MQNTSDPDSYTASGGHDVADEKAEGESCNVE